MTKGISAQFHQPAKGMERTIARVLSLLKSKEHGYRELKLKVNCPSDQLRLVLEWGETHRLWLKDPISQAYMISDTGELILARHLVKDLLEAHPLELVKSEIDQLLEKLKHVESCLGLTTASKRD